MWFGWTSRKRWGGTKAIVLLLAGHAAACGDSAFREDFATLDGWEALTFPKIGRHTEYSIQTLDGQTVLKAEADASASGLVHANVFNPYETPILRFRWRADNVLEKGNASRKDGDDYPIRIYVFFPYHPDAVGWRMRAQYGIARRLHGAYPPHYALVSAMIPVGCDHIFCFVCPDRTPWRFWLFHARLRVDTNHRKGERFYAG